MDGYKNINTICKLFGQFGWCLTDASSARLTVTASKTFRVWPENAFYRALLSTSRVLPVVDVPLYLCPKLHMLLIYCIEGATDDRA